MKVLCISNFMLGGSFPLFSFNGKKIREVLRKRLNSLDSLIKDEKIETVIFLGNFFGTNLYTKADDDAVKKLVSDNEKVNFFIIPGDFDSFDDTSIYKKASFVNEENVKIAENSLEFENLCLVAKSENINISENAEFVFSYNKDIEIKKNKIYIFQDKNFEFSENENVYIIPPFEFVFSEQKAAGYLVINTDEKKAYFFEESEFKKYYLNIDVEGKNEEDIEKIILSVKGEKNIVFADFKGILTDESVIKFIGSLDEYKSYFFHFDYSDYTKVSDEFFVDVSKYGEFGMFINDIKTEIEDKDLQDVILKKTLELYGKYENKKS